MGKRKSAFLRALEARREAARQEQPEETNEPEGEAPASRILRERPPLLWPAKKRRPPGSEERSMHVDLRASGLAAKRPNLAKLRQVRAKFQRRGLGRQRLRRAIGGGHS